MGEIIVKSDFKEDTTPILRYATPCFVSSSGTLYAAFEKRIVICPIQTTVASPKEIIIVSDASVIQRRATWSFIIAD
jgi:hypothetical protein